MVEILGSFASALMSTIMDRITGKELMDFFRGNQIDAEPLEELKVHLLSVAKVLSDAEEKQFIDPCVKEWVDKLKNAAYDADDFLDEIVTKATHPNFHPILYQATDYALALNPFSETILSRVKSLVERLKSLVQLKDLLDLKEGGVPKLLPLASATTSLVNETRVIGRKNDKEEIINFLLSGHSNGEMVPVVAIVGMEGVGKTTLAQIVYNDARVIKYFDSRSWTSVSETSNVHEITKNILESFRLCQSNISNFNGQSSISDFNGQQVLLKDILTMKRVLLVLDGFENEDFLDWDTLQRPFLSAKWGSVIIITTRSPIVAEAIRANLTHSLPILSENDIWKLFSSHAFKSVDPNVQSPVLTQIGHKIVKKCGGLPGAAVTLGSLLRSKDDYEKWEDIYNSTVWDLSRDKSNIFYSFRLRYHNLPSLLKRCFAYCSIFPKGFKIEKWDLIYKWMAEGILPQSTMGKRPENLGEKCFDELVSRSFFQLSTHDKQLYVMHEFINDLAQCVAGEFCYKLDDSDPTTIVKSSVRRISYLQGIYDDLLLPQIEADCEQLRTLLPFAFSPLEYCPNIDEQVSKILSKPKRFRVFSLSRYPLRTLPNSIDQLMHLRYLDLSYTVISCLPDSFCTLYNLETLLLVGCASLTKLPANTSNLVNLRRLDISESKVKEMPLNFGKLTSLQLLSSFVVGDDGGSTISELEYLKSLHGSLSIMNLHNVLTATEGSKAILKDKKYIHELEFSWMTENPMVESENVVMNMLEPHPNLKRLHIHSFGGDKFPNWLGNSSISNMVFLHLDECENCSSLPSLGQMSCLRELQITKMTRLQKVGPEFYGKVTNAFSCLKVLKFKDMLSWEEWFTDDQSGSKGFALLQELYIEGCPKLTGKLPDNLPSLVKLVVTSCPSLRDPMPHVPRLIELDMTGCEAFRSLSQQMMQVPYFALTKLRLKCCDSLYSLPLNLFPSLEDLRIQECSFLHTLLFGSNGLPCLRKLAVKDCSMLNLFPLEEFHAPKLESLSIGRCAKLSFETAWGLQAMPSLTSLRIHGFTSLTSLEHIGIESLNSLRLLKIKDCAKLESLTSITYLFHLIIRACPLLKKQCEKGETETGKYLSMVSRFDSVNIN